MDRKIFDPFDFISSFYEVRSKVETRGCKGMIIGPYFTSVLFDETFVDKNRYYS